MPATNTLNQKPIIKSVPMASDAHAGGIYYFNGWNVLQSFLK